MFVVLLKYVKPVAEIDAKMKAHMAYMRAGYKDKIFITSGRQVPRTGGVILARAADKEELIERIEQDPFIVNGLATYEIIEFKNSQFDPDFKEFTLI